MTRIEQNMLPVAQTPNRAPNRIDAPQLSKLANRVNKLLEEEKLNAASSPEEKPTSFNTIRPSKPSNLRALGDRVFAQLEEEEKIARIGAQIEEQELAMQEEAPPINPRRVCPVCRDPNCPFNW